MKRTTTVQRLVWVVLFVLMAPLLPYTAATEGRSTIVTLEIPRHDWTSEEVVEIDLRLRNAPYNEALRAEWVLNDAQGINTNGTVMFTAAGTFTVVDVNLSTYYRGEHFHELSVVVYDSTGAVLGSSDVHFVVFRNVKMGNAGSLLAFGDSLSDMGNAKASILNTPDVPPYWQGRFSNGEVWLGGLYDAYGLTSSIGSGVASSGSNRAFGGAQTGAGYAYLLIPNVGTQITSYLANVQATIPSNAVVSLWAGGNDFLYGTANADTIASNMEAHIRQLAGAGARTLVVPNLPPLEDTPEIQSRSASQQANIRNEVIDYNNQLANIIVTLRAELGITIYTVDAWTIFGDITANKEALGLTNVQDAACSGGTTLLPLPICNSGSTIAANVDEYIFFDKAHPTSVMHDVIARFAVEAIGAADTDGDGVLDPLDQCSWTPTDQQANAQGCSYEQLDDDGDGVLNGLDECQGTALGDQVDEQGCSATQRDSDDDGLNDFSDPCPFSPNQNDHDGDGCTDGEDSDDDNDGRLDDDDRCPQGLLGPHMADLDEDGCADNEDDDIDGDGLSNVDETTVGSDQRDEDTDDDTWLDGEDAFPIDATEWKDTDRDGCGDNSDMFPFDSSECKDTDEDGVGDNADAFPTDEQEWNDLDDDGVGDNSDACRLESGSSLHPKGCPDRDGDGYANTNDAFPSDPTEWADADGDGYGDNTDLFPNDATDWADRDNDSYGDNRDAFPFDANEWNDTDGEGVGDNQDRFPEDPTEWNDTDDDGCGDNGDVFPLDPSECLDSDVDGVGDNADAFPEDASETLDSDGDGLGDNSDAFPDDGEAKFDSDGDGVADAYDAFPNSGTFSSWFGAMLWLVMLVGACVAGAVIYQRKTKQDLDVENRLFDEALILAPENRPLQAPVFALHIPPAVQTVPAPAPRPEVVLPDTSSDASAPISTAPPPPMLQESTPVEAEKETTGWMDLDSDWGA
jgi:phospholipase/lecithinase/hemolysin